MQNITVYTTGCPKCRILKQMLDSLELPYTENDDIKAMQDLGIQSVPVLEVDGDRMDFNAAVRYLTHREKGRA